MYKKFKITSGVQAQNRLFVIGNGFDLAHDLPTMYNPDFKKIAIANEPDNRFWALYQTECPDIWSDFENLLAKPEFDNLGEIFEAYPPDYLSDHERDRTSIIIQADISGNLVKSLNEFASNAEKELISTKIIDFYRDLFTSNSFYLNFNYTHTLETVYKIPARQILHIHGEAGGESDLLLGYDASDFDAGKITEDVTMRGHYRSIPTAKYIDGSEDYYIRTAYENLLKTIQSWVKPTQTDKLLRFANGITIDEVIVIGFSFGKVDAVYFKLLQQKFSDCKFTITAVDELCANDYEEKIVLYYPLKNYSIELL